MNLKKFAFRILLIALVALICIVPAFAAQGQNPSEPAPDDGQAVSESAAAADSTGSKAWAAALAVGLAAAGGALGMGMAVSKTAEGISRQPEAEGRIRTAMMLGLVFIETAIIYALIVAILIIFVL